MSGHWPVKPADRTKMSEWIESGPDYSLTQALKDAIIRPLRTIQ